MTDASGSVDNHRPGWLPWKRLPSEGALIVVSVFVAIALQSAWEDHTRAVEAGSATCTRT